MILLCSHHSARATYIKLNLVIISGAGTNLKVGVTDPAQSAGIFFLVGPLHFLALKAQLIVLARAFVMVSTVWSVSCLLFFFSRCLPCPAICKSGGGTCPPYPMESALLVIINV